jgi:DNA polymerase I-like protein with 3'-5' exonuclease and polymerase domains
MIYLVTKQQELFESDLYKVIGELDALEMMKDWNLLQFDTETNGRDAHLCDFLCVQFGNDKADTRIVVDTSTIDVRLFKQTIESKRVIGHNLKFDLQFLYNYGIIPRRVYDTMIVEQVLYLGYPHEVKSYSLKSVAWDRLKIDIDKSIRGEIVWKGLSSDVILYAAGDVTHLEKIMQSQIAECRIKDCLKAAELECNFVPVLAYMEWCGIKLDVDKWKAKMETDKKNLRESIEKMNAFVIKKYEEDHDKFSKFITINLQGDLWEGFDTSPKCNILWSSSAQVTPFAKVLGFDTVVQDAKTGEDKDSVLEKHLKKQKGIDDEFLLEYFGRGEIGDDDYYPGYTGSAKRVSSFGQGHLNAINPKTGRIHTDYRQLGADTSRMACGSKNSNTDLAKYKKLKPSECSYPNLQQLSSDEVTRSCFVSEKGNLWVSCDYSAIESRLGAEIYNEKSMIDEFLYGSGDMHSLVAKMIFPELKDVPIKDIKKKFKHLRSKAKPVEFSQQFGGSAQAIQNSMGCSMEDAEAFAEAYKRGFPGIAKFKEEGSKSVRKNGYIVLCKETGLKTFWWNHKKWLERQKTFTQEFWEEYKTQHKGTGDYVAQIVREHFKAASKWDRKALNSVTQGLGAVILKDSQIDMFNWVVDNGFFGKILLVNLTHDEANWEFPEKEVNFPKLLEETMEKSAAKYCHKLPIPAEASVDSHWVH